MLTTSFSGNVFDLLGSVMDSASTAVRLPFTIFSSIADADATATTSYPFPTFGFTASFLDNPKLADGVANANKVAQLLDQSCLNSDDTTNTSCAYVANAETCFGDEITNDNSDHLWDVIPNEALDPYDSSTYPTSTCESTSMDWQRIRMFILDTGVVEGWACANYGDPASCANDNESGQDNTGTSDPTDAFNTTTQDTTLQDIASVVGGARSF
jgi:hypothetical protein